MVQEEKSKKDDFKNAMCYIPVASVVLFFTESNRSDELNKHIKYGFFLLVAYMFLMFLLGWVFGGLLTVIYLGISGFMFYKVNNGDEVKLEVFDELEKTVKEKMDDNKNGTQKKDGVKKDNTKKEL